MAKYSGSYRDNLDTQEAEIQTPNPEVNEPEPTDAEDALFKKRYGDLRRHMQTTLSQKDDQVRKLQEQLDAATRKQIRFPKTEDEIAEWVQKYPDVAAIIDTIAQKRALEALEIGEKKMANLAQLERKLTREKAEQELLKLHPDFDHIRQDRAFHEWAQIQPKWVQDALYENDTDARAAARAIDLYKGDQKKKKPADTRGAAQSVGRSTGSTPAGNGKTKFRESEVAKMSTRDYEANEAAIMEAIRTGQFEYDLSGAAR